MEKVPHNKRYDGNSYRFGFINSQRISDIPVSTEQSFVKMERPQKEVDGQVRSFLTALDDDFWLKASGCRFDLIEWEDGDLVSGIADYKTLNAKYKTRFHSNTLTELVMVYSDLRNIHGPEIETVLFWSLRTIIYQYVRASSPLLRRKVLKVFKYVDTLQLNYKEMERSFIETNASEWKYNK